jgi:uncharacterized iron-regulated protein
MKEIKREYHPGQIVEGRTGRLLTVSQLLDSLEQVRAVFVGEEHDNPEHHRIQLEIIRGLYHRSLHLAVGMEMLPRESQAILDRWMEGEIKEEDFLRQVEWYKVWGYPFSLYRALLVFARDHEVQVAALNAPGVVVKKVAQTGLSGLNADERSRIAEDIRLDNHAHRQMIYQRFLEHPPVAPDFERFYEAQCVWDETMAETLARLFDSPLNAPHTVVVLSGISHMDQGLGIPEAFARRTGFPFALLIPARPDQVSHLLQEEAADYLWVI